MKELKLRYSLKHGESEINEIKLRRPTFRDFKKYKLDDLNNFSVMHDLTAQLSGLPMSVVDQIDVSDMLNCTRTISDFFLSGQEIQENAL